MHRTQDGWIREYQKRGALWIHDGNRKRPHALLTSGKHSGGFFNSQPIIADEVLLREAVSDLLKLFAEQGGNISHVEIVVGPQTDGTELAEFLCDQIMGHTRGDCYWASPAKKGEGGQREMIFDAEDQEFVVGGYVLLCNDDIITGETISLTIDAINALDGEAMSRILVLVNSSNLMEIDGREIIALVNHPMLIWEANECPLCKKGSKAIRPKENWDKLTATY